MARTVPSGPLDRIDTARLRAERLRPEHLDEVRRMQSDADTMTWLGGVATREQSRAYLERALVLDGLPLVLFRRVKR
jgi:hypothetical protein